MCMCLPNAIRLDMYKLCLDGYTKLVTEVTPREEWE